MRKKVIYLNYDVEENFLIRQNMNKRYLKTDKQMTRAKSSDSFGIENLNSDQYEAMLFEKDLEHKASEYFFQ